jgi:hypothetical protein
MRPAVLRTVEAALVGGCLLAFLVLKAYSIHATLTDDWIYAYLAQRTGEGVLPHRDFFFAHPPAHLLTLVPVMMVFDFSIGVVRAIPSLSAALAGLFLWAIVRREGGAIPALVTLVLFLFSYDVLRISSHVTGTNISLAYLSAGAWGLLRRRWILSGVLLALASLTALYTLPVIAGLCLMTAWRRVPGWKRAAVSFAAVFLGLQLLIALPAPARYMEQVYLYHRHKKENPETTRISWTRAGAHHGIFGASLPLAVGGFIALLGGRGGQSRRPERKRDRKSTGKGRGKRGAGKAGTAKKSTAKTGAPRADGAETGSPSAWRHFLEDEDHEARLLRVMAAMFLLCIIELFFLLSLREVYTYYLMIPYALLAVAMGLGAAAWIRVLRTWLPRITKKVQEQAVPSGPVLAAALLVAVGGFVMTEVMRPKAKDIYPAGSERRYEWKPAPLPAFLDQLIHDLFWRDMRVMGEEVSPVRRYLWHESRGIEKLNEIAAKVRQVTSDDDFLLGDSMLAPLVALASDRRILGDRADTNTKRFTSGVEPLPLFIESIDRPELRALVFVEGRFLDSFGGFHTWRSEHFEPVGQWDEPKGIGVVKVATRVTGG